MPAGFNHDSELIDRVLADNRSYREIAREFKVSVATVSHWKSGALPDYYLARLEGREPNKRGVGPKNQNARRVKTEAARTSVVRASSRHYKPEDLRAGR